MSDENYSGGVTLIDAEIYKATPCSNRYLIAKRTADFCVSLILGIVLIIPMLIIGIVIRADSPGKVLFAQERLGKDGKPFTMYKFRSMHEDAEEDGPRWADTDDPRCTKVGRVLRKSRLDELPQIWNILKGDMSFVGPRPERAYFYKKFSEYIPGFGNRLMVQPGLTGWAQVNGGYDLNPEEKLKYDMEYIHNRSLWMDFRCVIKTVKLVFTHEGAR